jgi:essential nuclear protein 1
MPSQPLSMPKATTQSFGRDIRRHNPLEHDILATNEVRQKPPKRKLQDRDDEEGQGYVESKQSKKILQLGRELVEEENTGKPPTTKTISSFDLSSRLQVDEDDDRGIFGDEDQWADEEEIVEEIEIDAKDLATFNKFLPNQQDEHPLLKHGWNIGKDAELEPASAPAGDGSTNLTELILARIAEFEMAQDPDATFDEEEEFAPEVIELYTQYVMPN